MAEKKNMDIRKAAKEAGVSLWQIADVIGVCENTFIRRLRHELSEEEREKALAAIEAVRAEQEG